MRITAAGITAPLKIALPAVVPTPIAKPSLSRNNNKPIITVSHSGNELPTALIVAPRTPS
ncbi:hypothetical protein THIOM_004268 [Candidatus Thiomargarita nelsonii]|uniref:Uncharacterized protein n=1 Tax=Candidatus Thiomargarita nelsonii TaxID=1003181 RepID=A0A176RW94_9GAMM|nr:hypothetical protein THIOM_004268 [Candidatus Thiomargarita nelsonii]